MGLKKDLGTLSTTCQNIFVNTIWSRQVLTPACFPANTSLSSPMSMMFCYMLLWNQPSPPLSQLWSRRISIRLEGTAEGFLGVDIQHIPNPNPSLPDQLILCQTGLTKCIIEACIVICLIRIKLQLLLKLHLSSMMPMVLQLVAY